MPTWLASARGESRLALVRDVPDVAHGSAAPTAPARPAAGVRMAAHRDDTPAGGESWSSSLPWSTTRGAAGSSRRLVGAVALVAALGTVLLAALAASATLAWAGG